MSKFHVSQIETYVRGLYEADHWNPQVDEVNNLSRLLARRAIDLILGADDATSLDIEITDGEADRGIDAVGVDQSAKVVVFVQSKWRQDGTGSMALGDVLKFLQGVRSLLGMKAEDEPLHATEEMKASIQALLKTPGARIRLVTATTASEPLASEVEQPVLELLANLNDLENTEPMAGHRHLSQADLFNSISEAARPAVDLELQMLDWGRASEPQKMYYGRVSASEIAGWFSTHGADLFAENIRVVIPRSDINDGILETIKLEPENFTYYNNGLTVLAQDIELGPGGILNKDVGYFRLKSASIVNGAQTVSTLGSVLGTDYEANLGNSYVIVRCIVVPAGEEKLGQRITRFANTQNEVSSQDFAFLDGQQHRLASELQVIGYEYILRSAEVPKTKDKSRVIDVRDAAVALACAASSVNYAIIAKREVSRLVSEASVYSALFNSSTDPLRLSRAVVITAKVDAILDELEATSEGIVAGVAIHGRRVIAHLVLTRIGDKSLADPDSDIDELIKDLDSEVQRYLAAMVEVFPENAYPGNVFKNQARVVDILTASGLR